MNPLSLLPTGWLLPAAAIGAGALALAIGVQTVRLDHAQAALAVEKGDRAADRAAMAEAAASASEAYRTREHVVVVDQSENLNEAERISMRSRAAVAGAAGADAGLRVAARAAAASCSPVPSAAAPAASSPADRLADVLAESTERYRAVAEAADRAIVAGSLCAGDYDDALKPR